MVLLTAVPGMGTGVVGLFLESGWVGKGIVFILLGFSVVTWAMILLKYQFLKRAEAESHAFLAAFRKTKNVRELHKHSESTTYSPLVSLDEE